MVTDDCCNSQKNDIAQSIHELLVILKEIEILPHHIDETLFDKLLDVLDFTDINISFMLENEINSEDIFTQSSMYVATVLRLIEKCVESKTINSDRIVFSQFLEGMSQFLNQQRPPFVIAALFRLCVAGLSFRSEWNDVLKWAAENFQDGIKETNDAYSMTVFVRNQAEELFKRIEVTRSVEESLQMIASICQSNPIMSSVFVVNSIFRIANVHQTYFKEIWDSDMLLNSLLSSQTTLRGLASCVYDYLSKNIILSTDNLDLLTNNCQFALNFWISYFKQNQKLPNGIDSFLLYNCTLDQLCIFLPFLLKDKPLDEILDRIKVTLGNQKGTNSNSLLKFLDIVVPIAEPDTIIKIIESCSTLISTSPDILMFLAKQKTDYFTNEKCPRLTSAIIEIIRRGFHEGQLNNDFELVEICLQTALIVPNTLKLVVINDDLLFHENQYVASSALKCLLAKESKDVGLDACVRVIQNSLGSQSKLIALETLYHLYPESREHCSSVLETALEDDDNENRWMAFNLGKRLMDDSESIRTIFLNYIDDYLIGSEVRRILEMAPSNILEPSMKTIDEIIDALNMVYVDVPDCS